MSRSRCYTELSHLGTFEQRFDYLELSGQVGQKTFGFDRWINQQFYSSHYWHHAREEVILRDQGCDLGIPGYEIHHGLRVHHMNPLSPDDIKHGEDWIIDPEFLICTSLLTHNAIHYGNRELLPRPIVARQSGDTKLW